MKKIKLVFILGFGHSGSTMLDLILGAMPNAESVGEIIRLRKELDWNHPCTCGKDLKDCPYWSKVLFDYEAKIDSQNEDIFEFTKLLRKGKVNTFFKELFKYRKSDKEPHLVIEDYGKRSYALFQSILEYTGKQYIVDSSKNHRRLILLWLSGLFDIRIVYLYRDSNELINSLRRRKQSEYKEVIEHHKERELDPQYVKRLKKKLDTKASLIDISKYVISINRSVRNKLTSLEYLKSKGLSFDSVHFLNYREIVESPSKSIRHLSSKFDLDFNPNALDFESPEYFLRNMGHNLGGNFMRTKGAKPIVAKKVKPLSASDRALNNILGGVKADKKFSKMSKKY